MLQKNRNGKMHTTNWWNGDSIQERLLGLDRRSSRSQRIQRQIRPNYQIQVNDMKKSPFCYTFYFDSLFYNNNCSMQNLYSNFFNKIRALTGISFSEALIVASNNPQYDKRLFMELPWKLQAQNMGRTCSALVVFMVIPWTICCHIVD